MFAESPDDTGSLRACLTALHQVNVTLQMVQLDGPTQVAREMEDMAQALMNSSVPDVEKAQEVLMQSILQMPAYLYRIQREQADTEANYMPIVNNLRLARGEERIGDYSEEEAKEDLSAFQTPAGDESLAAFESGNGATNVPKLRARYQQALVAVIKKSSVEENLTLIGKVFSMLIKLCGNSPVGNLSRLGLASIEAITSGAIKLNSNSANALKAVDKVLKQLSEDGVEGLNQPISDDLVQSFISVIDGASKDTPKIVDAREVYKSKGGGDDTFEEVAIGPDDETLSAVARILKEELTSVTDKLDLFVRSAACNDSDLVELLPMLEQISSTLVVVGLTQHQETVGEQVAFIKSVKDGEATPDEEHLLDMARALIEIEASLGVLAGDSDGGDGESFGDLNDAQAAVVSETRNGLAKCKDAVIEFVSSDFDYDKLETLSDALLALRGGLLIANQERSGDVLVAASHYVNQLMSGKVRPELSHMDDLADAITSIDYYLERLLESANDPYIQMIEVAEEAVEKLGFAVGVEPEVEIVEPEESDEVVEETPETEEQPEPTAAVTEVVEDDDDLIDEEILEIFVEEAEEVLETISEYLPQWREDTSDADALAEIRRAFHTLKGSGRMVGATVVGELAWSIENMLNRVIDNSISPDDEMLSLIETVTERIPEGVEAFRNQNQDAFEVQEMVALAEAITNGGAAPAAEVVAPAAEVELPPDDVDDDILPIFLEETEELLEGIDESIQGWSESPDNSEPLDLLLRHLHTLKGGSRMAGLNSLGEYTHNFETYLIGIQSNPVELNEQFFASLNQQQDEITRRVGIYTRLAAGEASGKDLASLLTSKEPATEQAAPAPQSADEPPTQEPEKAAPAASDAATPAAQEMVRVSADLLEELIGLAGESSINGGRVEQQISDFGDAIQEMEDTINRVRDQVRRLEIEAESRETLISQHGEGESAFDELEMDRYTMLQEISRTLNESSSDMLDLKDTLVNRSRDAETLLHQQARIASELQEGLTRTRMVTFARLIPRLRRIVRQVSGEIGKSVRFDAFNVEGELDRSVLDRITAPLEHMLRNAVDHGIESAEKRAEAGKPDQGRISLRLSREGGYVILTISDDGGGINVEAVRAKAIDRGLISEGSDVSDHEVMQFIMHAGFSTAQKLTQIFGRGVGMDVVGSEIKALGGSMSIDSILGVGSEFTIRIPFTVSINRALMIVVKEETYAVPLNTIHGIHRVSPYELEAYYQPDAPPIEIFGEPYRLEFLGSMLDKSHQPSLEGQVAPLPVILASSGDNAVALQVDRVIGSREVVVKTLGPQFSEVGGISGATILGDGSVVVILDVMALVRSHETGQPIELTQVEVEPEPEPETQTSVRTVMIVDDSVTVRKVTSRLMERQGWDVVTAKDGLDAVTQLQDIYPDIVLLDIEMPKIDGFEVLRRVRADERLKNLPIIMITSRTGEKHQQQALELGVNKFLGKPFQEANLISTIEEVIGGG